MSTRITRSAKRKILEQNVSNATNLTGISTYLRSQGFTRPKEFTSNMNWISNVVKPRGPINMSEIKPAIMPEIPKNLRKNKAYVNWHSTFIAPLFPEPEPKPKKPKVNKTNKTLKNIPKNNKPVFNKELNNFMAEYNERAYTRRRR